MVVICNHMSKHTVPYSLQNSLGHLTSRLSRLVLRRLGSELAGANLGITADHYTLLVHLWEHDGLSQGTLAEKSGRDKTTMARLAATLEERGLIERRPSPRDGRERLLSLSDAGKATMDQATDLARTILDDAKRGIGAEELEICRNVLRRAGANLLASPR